MSLLSALGSVFAGLGFVTCCGTPILASVLSVFGLGASQLELFAKYQEAFLFISVLTLGIGFYQVYFKNKRNSCCSSPTVIQKKVVSSKVAKIMLWCAAIIVLTVIIISVTRRGIHLNNNSCCPSQEAHSCCS